MVSGIKTIQNGNLCLNCNTKIEDQYNFCPNCGNALNLKAQKLKDEQIKEEKIKLLDELSHEAKSEKSLMLILNKLKQI